MHCRAAVTLSTTNVLLVDDDEALLTATKRLLGASEPGWKILTAIDGKEAIDVVRTQPVAVVITDLYMPRADGSTLLRHLAQFHPETIRIVHSSHSATSTELGRAPAHRVVHKPASPAHFLTIVRWAARQAELMASGKRPPIP